MGYSLYSQRLWLGFNANFGDIVPFVGNLGGSGIWYYLVGLLIGIGIIVATLIGEVVVE